MKHSLVNLAFWIGCILSYTHAQGQIQGGHSTIPSTQEASRDELSQGHLDKRELPITMGLAANPDIITQDVAPIARRSNVEHVARGLDDERKKLEIRSLHMGLAANPDVITQDVAPIARRSNIARDVDDERKKLEMRSLHMGLAANPDVITQDVAPIARRSNIEHVARSVDEEEKKLEPRSLHMGLAANPDVITQDLPASSSQRRRRSIGNLIPSADDLAMFGREPSIKDLSSPSGTQKLHLSSESIIYPSKNIAGVETPENDPKVLLAPHQTSTQMPFNLNTVGLGKSVTLPLRRREKTDAERDLHPEIHFQKHLHHALRRHANFLDKSIDEDLLERNLRKRAESVGWQFAGPVLSARSLVARQASNETASAGFPAAAFTAAKSGSITRANPVTAANSMGLHIEANDVGYFAEIQIGTPPAPFRIILDTGSADSWVHLEDCRNIKDTSRPCNHPTLSPQSSTFKRTSDAFSITYGTGKVSGVLVEEKLIMGGLVLNNHIFGGVNRASDEFTGKNVPFDGLMGTAKSVLSNQKVLTPIEAMAKAGTLTGAFIGYALGRVSDSENVGQVTLGGIDQTKFSGDLTVFPNVNKKGFWEGAMDVIQIGGKTILTDRTGILDTGTTLIVVPAEDAKVVHNQIPGAVSDNKGGFRIPCTNTVKVGLSFGGVIFEINPVDMTFQPVTKNLKGLCISGISVGLVGGPAQWLIGDVFLKNVYFATDVTNNQMGLAVLNPVSPKN